MEALTTTELRAANVTLDGSDVMAFWFRAPSAVVQTIVASKLSAAGNALWMPAQLDVATAVSGKSRLFAEMGPGSAVLSWEDDRAGNDDVFAQNVNVDGTLGSSGAGPGEVAGLVVDKNPGSSQLTLAWGASCSPGADYGVFEGTLASLRTNVYDHGPLVCIDASPFLQETFVPSASDAYYLIVPLGANAEGSHGTRFDGVTATERPVGPGLCEATQTFGCP